MNKLSLFNSYIELCHLTELVVLFNLSIQTKNLHAVIDLHFSKTKNIKKKKKKEAHYG